MKKLIYFKILGFFILLLLFTGCSIKRGVLHTVGRGETLWRICYTYGVDLQEVAELNDIRDPTDIKAGRRVFIPGVRKVKKVDPYAPIPEALDKYPAETPVFDKTRFIWPVTGEISSSFGVRNGITHDGVDIRAPRGTEIRAAADGRVVYVESSFRGYGKMIILSHTDDFYTVYAHNDRNLVSEGDEVKKGDVIATIGESGNATGPHLHFEVRKGKTVRNPLFFLP